MYKLNKKYRANTKEKEVITNLPFTKLSKHIGPEANFQGSGEFARLNVKKAEALRKNDLTYAGRITINDKSIEIEKGTRTAGEYKLKFDSFGEAFKFV